MNQQNQSNDDLQCILQSWTNQEEVTAATVADAIPKFKQVTTYTTFVAEYCMINSDIVIHFFETNEYPATNSTYWSTIFAEVLDKYAQNYFGATSPRLVAKYTEEMKSWWFKACNYDHLLDLDNFISRFFDGLDSAIDRALKERTR